MLIWHPDIFFGGVLVKVLVTLINSVVCVLMFDFVFCKYFLPVYILPSHSLDVSFEEQKC